jgi:hypothetical protein
MKAGCPGFILPGGTSKKNRLQLSKERRMKVANKAIYRQIGRWKFPVDRG